MAAIIVLCTFYSPVPQGIDLNEANSGTDIDSLAGESENNANTDINVNANTVYDQEKQKESGDNTESEESGVIIEDNKTTAGRVIDPTKPMVAITFDDGPSAKYTEKILDILAEYDSVATFFEIGNLAERYPELIKKEIEAGCELGNHSYSHPNLKNISLSEAIDEINKTNDIYTEITGSPATVIRPPYGAITGDIASNFDQPVVTWSVDTLDWQSRDADAVLDIIYDEGDLDGKVILMHSIYSSTYDAVCELVPYLIENGYQLVTVSELYEYKYGESMENGEVYNYTYFQ